VVAVRQYLGANPCKPMSEKPPVATVPLGKCRRKKDECRITSQHKSLAALFLHSSFCLLHLLLAREQTNLRRILDHMII
jgi:urease accessory protein UreE